MQMIQHVKNHRGRHSTVIRPVRMLDHIFIRPRVGLALRSRLTMHRVLLALAIIATFTTPAHTQSAGPGIAKDGARGSTTARLSVEALCAQLTLDEVTAIMGKDFERRPDAEQSFQECKYGDRKDKQRVRYFSLGSSIVNEASWRKMVESGGKGKVTERDGVLVGHSRGKVFGALDEIWFKDKQGRALYLRVNAKITEDQAVELAKASMN